MDSIGVRELRNQVAAVVRRAASGERITVTVDGVPTAQLGPLEPTGQPELADLVAAGLVDPPRRDHPAPTDAEPVPIELAVDVDVDRVLDELRGR